MRSAVRGTLVVLLVLGVRFVRENRYWWFFAALALFTLTIAFGGHTPIYRLYYELLPGTQRFRAPSISFFLFSFSLATMAAITLERMARARDSRDEAEGGSLVLWLGGGVAVAVAAAVAAPASSAIGSAAGSLAAQAAWSAGSASEPEEDRVTVRELRNDEYRGANATVTQRPNLDDAFDRFLDQERKDRS